MQQGGLDMQELLGLIVYLAAMILMAAAPFDEVRQKRGLHRRKGLWWVVSLMAVVLMSGIVMSLLVPRTSPA